MWKKPQATACCGGGFLLIRDQVVQVREPRQKRLSTATGMMTSFHREQWLPLRNGTKVRLQRQGRLHQSVTHVLQGRIDPGRVIRRIDQHHALHPQIAVTFQDIEGRSIYRSL